MKGLNLRSRFRNIDLQCFCDRCNLKNTSSLKFSTLLRIY